MSLRDVNLNQLPVLQVLLNERSVSKAADRLGLTQSTVSNALSKLRQTFNDELLVMVGREMRLTPRAEQLIDVLAEIHDLVEVALSEAEFDASTCDKEFIIASTDAVMVRTLPTLSNLTNDTAPGVTLKWANVTRASVNDLRNDMIDLIIAPPEIMGDEMLLSRSLYTDKFVCVFADGSWKEDEMIPLDEYLSRGHFATDLFSPDFPEFQNAFSADLAKLRSKQQNLSVLPSYTVLPFLIRDTRNLALVQESYAKVICPVLGLRYCRPPIDIPDIELAMLWSPRRRADPLHKWMREMIVKACAS